MKKEKPTNTQFWKLERTKQTDLLEPRILSHKPAVEKAEKQTKSPQGLLHQIVSFT